MGYYETFHPLVFLYSLLFGGLLYIFYDLLRFIRYALNNRRKVVVITDIIFMTVFSLVSFIFSLAYNFGSIRFYMIIGMLVSIIALRFTLGKLSLVCFLKIYSIFCMIFEKIFKFFKKVLSKLLKLFTSLVYNLGKKKRYIFYFKKGRNYDKGTKKKRC